MRRASGHPLCAKCLEEVLARSFKRSIRGLDAFRPGVSVGVYISALDPLSGVTLAYVAGLVESEYGGRVVALRPGYVELGPSSLSLLGRAGVRVEEAPDPGLRGSIWAPRLLRVERGAAALAASRLGLRVALLPVTRTMLSALGLEALMSGSLDYMADYSEGSFNAMGVTVAYGFRAVESEAVRAYAALAGALDAESRVSPEYRFKPVFQSVASTERPELEYSSLASISLIASTLESKSRCRVCGAPIEGGSCCADCASAWRAMMIDCVGPQRAP